MSYKELDSKLRSKGSQNNSEKPKFKISKKRKRKRTRSLDFSSENNKSEASSTNISFFARDTSTPIDFEVERPKEPNDVNKKKFKFLGKSVLNLVKVRNGFSIKRKVKKRSTYDTYTPKTANFKNDVKMDIESLYNSNIFKPASAVKGAVGNRFRRGRTEIISVT